jgi:hypothetical protein
MIAEKKELFMKRFNTLSDNDKEKFKILYHNHIEWVYDEVETENEIIPTIADKQTGETYNVFDYIEDKTNIVNTTHYLMGTSLFRFD